MIPKFKVLNKQTDEFIPSENTIIQDGKLYLNYRDFEDGISAKSEIYEVMFKVNNCLPFYFFVRF